MDVGTNIKLRLQGRQMATGLHWLLAADHVSTHHEIFKKTPFVSGLHPVSRDVVKDIREIGSIPFLTTTMIDQDVPQGFACTGRTIAEKPTAVSPHSHQGVLRSADKWIAAPGDVVGAAGNRAMDATFTRAAFDAGFSNGKLTDRGWDAGKSKGAVCATNPGSGICTTFAERDPFANAGASLLDGDLEKHSHADI